MIFHASAASLVALLLASAALPACVGGGIDFAVESVTDLGPLSMPATVPGRDGGWSGPAFGKVFWSFGDTFITVKGEDGLNIRSSTGAWSAPDESFTSLTEPLTASGIPHQLVPYTAEENAANAEDAFNGYAVWGAPVLAQRGDELLFLYSRIRREHGDGFDSVGVGIARVRDGETIARRDEGLLFGPGEPLYGNGAAFVDGDTAYLYHCEVTGFLDMTCRIGRAPLARVHERAAYEFYDGRRWTADISRAEAVVDHVSSGFSVAWNDFLGAYVAVHQELLGHRVAIRTAPAPEGPWSEPKWIDPAEGGIRPALEPNRYNYLALQHPALAREDGREITVTYSRPLAPFRMEVRSARIRLAP